jgi:hypothetical protein
VTMHFYRELRHVQVTGTDGGRAVAKLRNPWPMRKVDIMGVCENNLLRTT